MAKTGENPNKKKVDLVALAARRDGLAEIVEALRKSCWGAMMRAKFAYINTPTIKNYRRLVTARNRAR